MVPVAPECSIGLTENETSKDTYCRRGVKEKAKSHLIQSHSSPRRPENHCNDDTVSWRPEEMYSINKKNVPFYPTQTPTVRYFT
jgi:hypothetical protein